MVNPQPVLRGGVLLVHPGTQHSFRLAQQFAARGLLSGFWTGLAVRRGGLLCRAVTAWGPRAWRDAIANRVLDEMPARSLHTRPWIELLAQAALRRGQDPQTTLHRRNRRLQEAIPDSAFRRARLVVGFDTASWILARRAERAGIALVLDRSAPPPASALLGTLARKHPTWNADLQQRNSDVAEAERREHEAASCIAVASGFARRCLVESGLPGEKIAVIPYGVDAAQFTPQERGSREGPVRFLYAGAVTAFKGVPVLLDAWRQVGGPGAELTLVGSVRKDRLSLLRGIRGVSLKGRVPHAAMPAIYASHDVLVFPSYHDGFGLVILEAMAAGLAVITTSATAGPDLITDADEGFVVAPGDADALAARMRYFIEDPPRARRMGRAARDKASRYTWGNYGAAWAGLLQARGFL